MSRLNLTIALIFSVVIAWCQQVKFEPSKPLNQSSIDRWTTDQGLNSNNLIHIMQAKSGFLWICTYDGLLRFDGINFDVFDKESIPFLKSNAFYRTYEDRYGKIWITTQASGLLIYDQNTFKSVYSKSNLPKSVRCMLQRESGEILVGTNNHGLYIIQDSVATPFAHPDLQNISIMDIFEDANNNIWIATNGNGLFRITGTVVTVFKTDKGLASNVVNTVASTKDGRILIGTESGFNIFYKDIISTIKITESIQINSIKIDSYQSIWLATERGLIRINEGSGLEEKFSNDQGLPALALSSITFDQEGNLWITTNKAGLVRLKDSGIITYHQALGLSLDLANIAYEDTRTGKLYLGSDGGDVDIFEDGKFGRLQSPNIKNNIGIRDFCVDRNGTLWIGSYNGILKKDKNQETIFNTTNGLPVQDVRRILEDKKGILWFATRSGGVIKFKDDKIIKIFNQQSGLNANYILSLEEDRFGNIYVGTNGGGLSIIQQNDSINTFHITPDDSGILIFNIHIDSDGSVWLITSSGIYLFDGKTFRSLPLLSTQHGEVRFDWVEDDFGNIWISSNKGILRITSTSAKEFKRGSDKPFYAKIFGKSDGMRNRECTSTTRSLKTSIGNIWIPTLGGYSVINPKNIIENLFIPPVFINRLTTDNRTYYPSNKVVVEPGNLRYTFYFTSLSLTAPDKNQFKYRLEGAENNWHTSFERQVTYTNLSPGDYTFQAMGSNNDGVWNDRGGSMAIVILPYFYQSNYFYFGSVGFILLIFMGIYKWRVHDIEKRNKELQKVNSELDKFVYSASHDLRAPLSSVLGVVNIARLDPDLGNKETYLGLIEKSIKKLDGFISDIINFSRNARLEVILTEIDFEQIINEILDDLKYLDENNKISHHVSSVGTGRFYTDSVRLKIILSNLISNAFKYSNPQIKKPFIEVKIRYDNHEARIKIIDNGLGIAEQHIPNIFKMFYRASEHAKGSGIGLYIAKETIEKIKGKIEVRSKVGEGAEFEVILPSAKK